MLFLIQISTALAIIYAALLLRGSTQLPYSALNRWVRLTLPLVILYSCCLGIIGIAFTPKSDALEFAARQQYSAWLLLNSAAVAVLVIAISIFLFKHATPIAFSPEQKKLGLIYHSARLMLYGGIVAVLVVSAGVNVAGALARL